MMDMLVVDGRVLLGSLLRAMRFYANMPKSSVVEHGQQRQQHSARRFRRAAREYRHHRSPELPRLVGFGVLGSLQHHCDPHHEHGRT